MSEKYQQHSERTQEIEIRVFLARFGEHTRSERSSREWRLLGKSWSGSIHGLAVR
jgi:hypothetical protein